MAGQVCGVGRGGACEGAADDGFIVAPDDSPDIEEHDPAEPSADADGEDVVIVASDLGVSGGRPIRGVDDDDRR